MTDSGRILAPASTIITASRVPATTRSSSLSASWLLVGLVTNSPLDAADADRADGAHERDLADAERRRGAVEGQDVGIVLLVGREDRQDDLDVVVVALREERAEAAGR